jgi:hypothetical protein
VAGRSGFLALGLIVAAAAAANAQEPPRGFAWGASGVLMFWTEEQDPFDRLGGPGAQVSYLAPNAIGFEFRATYLVESGFYGLNGVNGELALTWSIPTGRHLVQLKAGGHGMLAGDSDGSIWSGGGPYGGGGAIIRLGGRIGLQLDLLGRLFVVSGRATFAPGGAVALVLLPR